MDNRDFILDSLGAARMEPYLRATNGHKRQALNLYRWSVRLAASVQEVLGITEVLLRNAIDRELQDWNNANLPRPQSWLLEKPAAPLRGLIKNNVHKATERAEESRARRKEDHPRRSEPLSHDDVLAHIMFSFWRQVLPNHAPDANRDDQRNKNKLRLWEEAISKAFPHVEDPDGKQTFWRVSHLVELRNRVSHMDSLLHVDIEDVLGDAFALVESIDPQLRVWLTSISTVKEIIKQRPK
ncbi:hypothetical protein [Corynebacterium urealyticum]|uniref:hypothetical protein n=1 Tax=Corynebacterium urealyticum TaxID=43771 RepID=UPI0021CC51ED|nr:hypothetical protein [Corynebacterium urealyticum]